MSKTSIDITYTNSKKDDLVVCMIATNPTPGVVIVKRTDADIVPNNGGKATIKIPNKNNLYGKDLIISLQIWRGKKLFTASRTHYPAGTFSV